MCLVPAYGSTIIESGLPSARDSAVSTTDGDKGISLQKACLADEPNVVYYQWHITAHC